MEDKRIALPAGLIEKLVALYAPKRIHLFGSRSRGGASDDSDYDLMVIVPDDAPPERRDCLAAYDFLWDDGVAADVLVWTESAYERRRHLASSLPATIDREGTVIYAA